MYSICQTVCYQWVHIYIPRPIWKLMCGDANGKGCERTKKNYWKMEM